MNFVKLVIVLLAVCLSGCNSDSPKTEIKEIYIDHYKAECYGFALSLCMRSKLAVGDEWSLFYEQIEGFNYEWGYVYKLKVKITDVVNPPEDGPAKIYRLIEVLSKENEPSTTLFDIAASRVSDLVINLSAGLYELYGEKEFSCMPVDCSSLESLLIQDMAILFEFSHNADPSSPMTLIQIKCSSSRETFNASCL